MELLRLLDILKRRWKFLAAGAVVAVAMAIVIGGAPPATGGVAWTQVALDTPKSQLVESAPRGADTLPWRASLIAHLMLTDATQKEIAQRLGVRPDQVFVVDTGLSTPTVPASMPSSAAEAAELTVAPYVLTVFLANPYLPVITVQAAAPDPAQAKRLAAAGVAVLESHTSVSEAPYTSKILTGGGVALKLQPYVVQAVAPIRAKVVTAPAPPVKQLGVPLFFLLVWSAGVVLLPRLVRRRRPGAIAAAR